MTRFEFLSISNEDKSLIKLLSPRSDVFLLSPLDKGLSGAIVLLAKWNVPNAEKLTKFHVLKIGAADKLNHEHKVLSEVAAPIIHNFPHFRIMHDKNKRRAVLCQEFKGDDAGVNRSLRQFIEQTTERGVVADIINQIFTVELKKWMINDDNSGKSKGSGGSVNDTRIRKNKKEVSYGSIFTEWIAKGRAKGGLLKTAEKIGLKYIDGSLGDLFKVNLAQVDDILKQIEDQKIKIKIGPVHGDLHSQNIVLDASGNVSLIDFGWTSVRWQAIDYIWLECSLKFVVCTPYISVENFLFMESVLNNYWGMESEIPYDQMLELPHGKEIAKIACGVATIRENARKFKVVDDKSSYLKGLSIMTYSLNNYPQLNANTLIHSLGYLTSTLRANPEKKAQYDELYRSNANLWGSRVGRIVTMVSQKLSPGSKCLDIGCGDGKNSLYLENLGHDVVGFDLSFLAIEAAKRRYASEGKSLPNNLFVSDANDYIYPQLHFDLVICYGLYHCLSDRDLENIHPKIINSIKHGVFFAFSTINNELPFPENHQTGTLHIRAKEHIFGLTNGVLDVVHFEYGQIAEAHPPLVSLHSHSITWALFQKR